MTSRRRYAAGIVHAQSFIIFGGYVPGSGLGSSSTEIVTEEGQVSQGPDMPTRLYMHAIAVVNGSTSIITGGCDHSADCESPITWYFNHVSQQFQAGPSLITGRRRHASGTIVDQETNENIVVVVGGYSNFLDSTELLISGEWKQGKNHAK